MEDFEFFFFFFFFVQGKSWNGYCQFPALGHDLVLRSRQAGRQARRAGALCARPGLEGLELRHPFGVATWLRLGLKGPWSGHEIHVVTWGR